MNDSIADLKAYVTANGRVCPVPDHWVRIWESLPVRVQNRAGAPLILAGWAFSNNSQKQARVLAQIELAAEHGALDIIDRAFRKLPESAWHHESDPSPSGDPYADGCNSSYETIWEGAPEDAAPRSFVCPACGALLRTEVEAYAYAEKAGIFFASLPDHDRGKSNGDQAKATPRETLNPTYFEARFTASPPPSGLPHRFGIVTAYNPNGQVQSEEDNRKANAELEADLVNAGLEYFHVTGGSADGSHREPGFGIAADSPEIIRPLSRRFRQDAFFWVDAGEVFVVATGSKTLHSIGDWATRLLR